MKRNFTVRHGALDGVEAFLSVARHRNFRKAASDLGVTPSALSQTVRTLEARMGSTLFIRTTRSVGLTEAGAQFLARAKPAFDELVAASEVVQELGEKPSGVLRLTVPRAVVPILLEPLLASFSKAYPKIEVELSVSAELVDIAAQGFDAGIRLGQFIEADMIAVRMTAPFRLAVVGSHAYVNSHGTPERIEDLRHHACIRMRRSDGSIAPWRFEENGKTVDVSVSGPLVASDNPTILGAAVEGMGLAQVPDPLVAESIKAGRLVTMLEPFATTTPGVFLFYPATRQMTPKLRAFINHVKLKARTTAAKLR